MLSAQTPRTPNPHLLQWPPDLAPPTQITPQIWQGPRAPVGSGLSAAGYDVVILCAEEHQPRGPEIPGVLVIHCPLDDDGVSLPSPQEERRILGASQRVRELVRQGRQVLVTCQMGLNRSGIVVAYTLMQDYRLSGDQAIAYVRERRKHALCNIGFQDWLRKQG